MGECGATEPWSEGTLLALSVRARHRLPRPGWRNWQTRRTQNPLTARSCGFKSRPGHGAASPAIIRRLGSVGFAGDNPPAGLRHVGFVGGAAGAAQVHPGDSAGWALLASPAIRRLSPLGRRWLAAAALPGHGAASPAIIRRLGSVGFAGDNPPAGRSVGFAGDNPPAGLRHVGFVGGAAWRARRQLYPSASGFVSHWHRNCAPGAAGVRGLSWRSAGSRLR